MGYTAGAAGERDRERERIKPVLVVFSRWTDCEGEGKSSGRHNYGRCPTSGKGGEVRVGAASGL